MRPFSLYLHIPFCLHKCPYCDFNTYALSEIPEKDYVTALLAELDFRAAQPEWHARTLRTIYFGGGTPSLFTPRAIQKIISFISRTFPVTEDVEISLEANPGTVSPDTLSGYRQAGVNRLSLGSQSFNPDTLKTLGRLHTPEQVEHAVAGARAAGISNINLDLIFGVPGQTVEHVEQDLASVLRLRPTHVSAYGLTIEKGTPFYQGYKKGTLILPHEEKVISMMDEINDVLPRNGLNRYEISNYALAGKEARHNMAYWDGDDYLGLGAGAHSFVRMESEGQVMGRRWSNFALPQKYMSDAVANGKAEAWQDSLMLKDAIFEFFFLGLRKISGVNLSEFHFRFGMRVEQAYPALVKVLVQEGLLHRHDDTLKLSERGLMLADSVIENFSEPAIGDHTIFGKGKIVEFPVSKEEKGSDVPTAANT